MLLEHGKYTLEMTLKTVICGQNRDHFSMFSSTVIVILACRHATGDRRARPRFSELLGY